jgi:hypothetical protein
MADSQTPPLPARDPQTGALVSSITRRDVLNAWRSDAA